MAKKQQELVSYLQQEASELYYDRMMYDINDSLTSILAVCDVEGKEAVPKIKQYIHRINQSLNSTKSYQSNSDEDKKFNVSLVLKNLVKVIEEKYKDVKMACLLSDIKAPVQGDQSIFEKLLLHVLVNMFFTGNSNNSEVLIEMRQKDQYAMITILKDQHKFSEPVMDMINNLKEDEGFNGELQITQRGNGVEVIIRIPLQFSLVASMAKSKQREARPQTQRQSETKVPVSVSTLKETPFRPAPRYAF